MDNNILRFVKRIRRRLRKQAILNSVIALGIAGLLIAVLISVVSLIIPMYYAIPIACGVILLSVASGIIVGICRTPSLKKSALMADTKGYKEKITTALELSGREDAFSLLQKKDTVNVIDNFNIRKEFPLQLSRKKNITFVLLAIIMGITGMIDTPARRQAVIRHEVKQEADKDVDRILKVKKDIEKADELTDVEKEEIDQQLEQALQDMRRAESIEDLKKAEDRITKKMEVDAEAISDASVKKTLADAVEQNKADQARRIEEAVSEASEAMDKASSDNEKNKREAYEKLNKLADVSGDESLKKAAKDYKESGYSNSDYLAANQALENAKDSMEADDAASSDGENSKEASSDVSDKSSGGTSANSGDSRGNDNNSNNGQGQNSNGQQGSQGQSGNDQGSNQGDKGQSSTGQQSGQGNGESGQGDGSGNGNGSGNGTGGGWNRGSKTGTEGKAKVNESVTIPDGTVGDDEDLSGKANGNDTTTKEKSSKANTWSGNKISYGQVSGKYKEKAYKKVNGSSYPGKMKEKIRDYFDGLE